MDRSPRVPLRRVASAPIPISALIYRGKRHKIGAVPRTPISRQITARPTEILQKLQKEVLVTSQSHLPPHNHPPRLQRGNVYVTRNVAQRITVHSDDICMPVEATLKVYRVFINQSRVIHQRLQIHNHVIMEI